MILDDLISLFKSTLFRMPSTDDLFNQYSTVNPSVDAENADEIRRENLRKYIESYAEMPPVLIVGEAPGPWGCRFSGVPFTGEAQYGQNIVPFLGTRSSRDAPLVKTKKQPPYQSMSSSIFWRVMGRYYPAFFVWNCVPIHPHRPDNPLSIRRPKAQEVRLFGGILRDMIDIIEPREVISLGKVAEYALCDLGIESKYIRHMSQGGVTQFRDGMEWFFNNRLKN